MAKSEDYYKAICKWNENNTPSYDIYSEGGFVHFNIINEEMVADDLPLSSPLLKSDSDSKGYKFHISLDDKITNIYKAWEVIFPILAKYRIQHFKVAPEGFDEDNKLQRGKEITVYAFQNSEIQKKHWEQLLEEITFALILHQITPGIFPNNPERKDEKILGSDYLSYRNDDWRVEIHNDPNNMFKDLELSRISKQAQESLVKQASSKELSSEFLLQSQGFFSKKRAVGLAVSTLIAVVGLNVLKGMKK